MSYTSEFGTPSLGESVIRTMCNDGGGHVLLVESKIDEGVLWDLIIISNSSTEGDNLVGYNYVTKEDIVVPISSVLWASPDIPSYKEDIIISLQTEDFVTHQIKS